MSNKIQILCNPQNQIVTWMIKNVWMRIERNTQGITNLEVERNTLIITILTLKQNQQPIQEYLFTRLAYIPTMIRWMEEAISLEYEMIKKYTTRLVIC